MLLKTLFLASLLLLLTGCEEKNISSERLTVGVVSFEESDRSVEQYGEIQSYLGQELKSYVELEPTYNEKKAIEQINRKKWDIVFASPGLAAIAISQSQYVPMFPLEGGLKTRSAIVVLKDSPITKVSQLAGNAIALGQPGSATGYYLPIYNLYGMTLKEIRLAATPKIALKWIADKEVAAGAMSLAEFRQYRTEFPKASFRILFNDAHEVPSGAILASPELSQERRSQISEALSEVSGAIAASAGYIPNASVPNYQYLIKVVERVTPIAERIQEKPAPLYEQK
jgi:phosphonate transport system substrate-binding protein